MKKLLVVISWACLAAVVLSARAQSIINPNNTVIRMNVHVNGTNFGHMDFELFDEEKPETVKNFLAYVYTGGYSNLVPHYLQPGYYLQAGHVRLDDITGTNDFTTFQRPESFGSIRNEYSTGTVMENMYGTLTMSPQTFAGFSAGSTDWLINMTNNSAFNTNDGYVVFGHVVNTAGPRTGTNLMNFFNGLKYFETIRTALFLNDRESFSLPVTAYFASRFPVVSEMYLINISIIQNGVARDTVAPTLQVLEPATGGTINTAGNLPFFGNASDNQRVARVIYDFGFPYQRFTLDHTVESMNWAGDLELIPRTNNVFVRAVDDFGNVSDGVERTFYYPFVKAKLEVYGQGKIAGLTNGQVFPIDSTQRFQAKPPRGHYFLGWSGDILSPDRNVSVQLNEGTNRFQAFFARTFIGLSNGTYHGLFYPTNGGPPRSAGWISLNLAANGRYSGQLNPLGSRFQIRGQLDGSGADILVGYKGTNVLILSLLLYPEPSAGTIIGTYVDGTNVSGVVLYRAQKFDRNNPPAQAGTYSFVISPTQDTSVESGDGYGFGTVTVDATGRIKMTGTLGDDVAIKQTGKLLKDNRWPFFAQANGGREAALGWAQLKDGVFTSDIKWWSPNFPGNTNQNALLTGSRYSNDVRLVNWTNGTITLSGGGLDEDVTADVVANEDGSFTLPSNPDNVQLGVPNAVGQFSGTLNHPESGSPLPLRGGTVQGSNIVAGFFGTKTNNGGFIIRRKP